MVFEDQWHLKWSEFNIDFSSGWQKMWQHNIKILSVVIHMNCQKVYFVILCNTSALHFWLESSTVHWQQGTLPESWHSYQVGHGSGLEQGGENPRRSYLETTPRWESDMKPKTILSSVKVINADFCKNNTNAEISNHHITYGDIGSV